MKNARDSTARARVEELTFLVVAICGLVWLGGVVGPSQVDSHFGSSVVAPSAESSPLETDRTDSSSQEISDTEEVSSGVGLLASPGTFSLAESTPGPSDACDAAVGSGPRDILAFAPKTSPPSI